MTSQPERDALCDRCKTRQVAHELPTLTDSPVVLQLCDGCYGVEMDQRVERAFRQFGVELETASKQTGTPLPEGMSGYEFVKSMAEESQRLAQTPENRARLAPMRAAMQRFAEEAAAELPGGTEHPEFGERVLAKMRPWMEANGPRDDEASA